MKGYSYEKNHAFVYKAIPLITVLIFFFANFSNAAEENQLKEVIKRVMPATVLVITYGADGNPMQQGSGFFINSTGEVITNYHVMRGAEKAAIKTPNGGIYNITNVIAEDLTSDLIKMQSNIGSNKVNFLTVNKTTPEIGDKVVIIGSPAGLESTVSDGIVSAVREVPGFGKIIQTTAPISPGSSGSPVVNMKGEVVGVASAQMLEGQNLNFVVPAVKIISLKEQKRAIAIREKERTKTQADNILLTAFSYYFKGDFKKALPFFEQYLKNNHASADVLFYTGFCYAALGRQQEAIQEYMQAIRIKPDLAAAHSGLGLTYSLLGRHQEAIQAFKRAISLEPDYAVAAHLGLGIEYAALGRQQEAIQSYMQAIRREPDFAEAHNRLANAYSELGRYSEAIEEYKQAIRIKPDMAEALYNLGCLYDKLGLYSEEVEAYIQAIRIKPDFAEAHNNLGRAYARLGRYSEAAEAFKQAIRLNPAITEAHLGLGVSYVVIGEKGAALEEYKILKELNKEKANMLFNMIYK